MSVPKFTSQRKDLRKAFVHALQNGGVDPFPTMAEERVFDSRQDPYIVSSPDPLPAITVYTDTQKRQPMTTEGGAPFMSQLEILIELVIGGVEDRIEIDRELEEKLDDFEEQVLKALFDITGETQQQLKLMFRKVVEISSMRLANNEGQRRLAMRDLIIVIEFDQRCKDLGTAFPQLNTLATTSSMNGEPLASGVSET